VQLLKDTAPATRHITHLATRQIWDSGNDQALQSAAKELGVTISVVEHSLTGHAETFRQLEDERPDALIVLDWTSLWIRRQAIYDFAIRYRTPVIYP
jgi:hypothetical protein